MTAEEFINKYKSIDSMEGYRLIANYDTDNKEYIWREGKDKPDPECHYVVIHRNNINNEDIGNRDYGKLIMSIGKDAPDDQWYKDEEFFEELDSYIQDDGESDEDFYNSCIKNLTEIDLILEDNYTIDRIRENPGGSPSILFDTIRKPVEFE